jgi:hypothetical protein
MRPLQRDTVGLVRLAVCAVALVLTSALGAQDGPPLVRFGTTVVIPSGLRGRIYHLRHWSKVLPNFSKLRPVGSIYTSSLDVQPQDFSQGFPGVTKRFEWFALNYTGRFWIEKAGLYRFALLSDDGSKLYIDGKPVIDNDGWHVPEEKQAEVELAPGIHRIRVSYFQGPKFQVALVLRIAGPGEELRVFTTDEFKPPQNPEKWDDDPAPDPEPPLKKR